jgi:hypothetical protein
VQALQSRWARPNPANLVNTSLPAREAPQLVPGTLAALTRNPHATSAISAISATSATSIPSAPYRANTSELYRRPTQRVVPSAEEFPSLGGSRVVPKKEPMRSFAELSREWVKTAKEKEEEDKKRVEEERSQQTPEDVFRHRVISLAPLNATAATTAASATRKEYDGIGGSKEEWSDESDLSDPHVDTEVLSPSDEDPDEFNSNIVWDRRSKNDMY